MSSLGLPKDYGYCVLIAADSVLVLIYLGIRVGRARKQFGVEYPKMYDDDKPIFNCFQRAHQNTLEHYPQFLSMMLLGGLQHPRLSAAFGAVWVLSRLFYAHGYYTGDPAKRMRGAWGGIGYLGVIGCAISFGLNLLEYI
ncbi:Microsomal glutathione S-transferase 3 [Trichoplax sp. H2]|nr:Microsomal glutathione S-transferase 3 [Trichoplax sp. H2]|eukprot:RDD43579.1 Microsomal glutathione S-transferase 3 [Trichoplax sp. H2]